VIPATSPGERAGAPARFVVDKVQDLSPLENSSTGFGTREIAARASYTFERPEKLAHLAGI
jgi:hypothetical protein